MTFIKFISVLVDSNIYIALAAVALCFQTQVQLGLEPQLYPYIFIIFFGTLLEYNFYPFICLLRNKVFVLNSNYLWIKANVKLFYTLVGIALMGLLIAIAFAKLEVLIILSPLAILTLFYSIPIQNMRLGFPQLRQLPYLKVFVIALVWSLITILLPVVYLEHSVDGTHLIFMILERFLFIMAITIPFDIRDMAIDQKERLKTIPLLIGEKHSIKLSLLLICLFLILSLVHYIQTQQYFILLAMSISAIMTIGFLFHQKTRNLSFYHKLILDGTLLFQGILTLLFYYYQSSFKG